MKGIHVSGRRGFDFLVLVFWDKSWFSAHSLGINSSHISAGGRLTVSAGVHLANHR